MYEGWIVVLESSFLQAAEITKGMLEENGIPCFVMNQQDSMQPIIGNIQLLVEPQNVMRAKYLIESTSEKGE